MTSKKVKICGITNDEDAKLASSLGAWALGFIFYHKSPRYISPQKAAEIISKVSFNIEKVGVFVNETIDNIEKVIKISGITLIQLHGEESVEFCKELKDKSGCKIIKAFRMKKSFNIREIEPFKQYVSYFLLDAYNENEYGGTGETFNWNKAIKIKQAVDIPIVLAGGINVDNINNAFKEVNPYVVDLSSSVEVSAGVKDEGKLKNLFNAIS